MDKKDPHDSTELAEVAVGDSDERRRRAGEIGHGEDDPKPRVGPRDADLHPIHLKLCGGLAVD